MLFTWDTTDLCIIFRQWHIYSTLSLVLSLVAVAALTAGYELVREMSRRYEQSHNEYLNKLPSKSKYLNSCSRVCLRAAAPLLKRVGGKMTVRNRAHYCGQGGM